MNIDFLSRFCSLLVSGPAAPRISALLPGGAAPGGVLPGGDALDVLEGPGEVKRVLKPYGIGDFLNGAAGVRQQGAGPLNAVVYEILDGGDAGQFFEEAAQVLGVAGDGVRQVF